MTEWSPDTGVESPGFALRERVGDYEALLMSEGLGLVNPVEVDERIVVIGGMHTGYDGDRSINHVIDEVATDQLLTGTGLTQRQYEVTTLLARDYDATADSVASDLGITSTMVHSHRRSARERLESVGVTQAAVFEAEPSKRRKEPETIDETHELQARIADNYEHLHQGEEGTARKRILEAMIRSTARGFVDRDPEMNEILTVQDLLKDYWSFELFGSAARSVYRSDMTEQRYSDLIRGEVVKRSLTYLNQLMETDTRPGGNRYSPQRDNPDQSSARHWYDTSDIRATFSRGDERSITDMTAAPVAPVSRIPQPSAGSDSSADVSSQRRLRRLLKWRPWGRRDES